jgi:cyclopropane fatty-acyl-phospholipid synthase-like methyltransferase
VPAIERADLHVTDIEVLRLHYAETLKDWRQRFKGNRDRIAAIYDERFCRVWELYLAACEAAFSHSGLEWERSRLDADVTATNVAIPDRRSTVNPQAPPTAFL